MNCRNTSTRSRRTWGWLRSGLLGAALALFGSSQAQMAYTLSTFNDTYTPISLGGGATASTAAGDDGNQLNVPIGFTFVYNGVNFTSVQVSTNGWMSFNAGTASTSFTNTNMYTTTGPLNGLFPWFDDLTFGVNSISGAPSLLYQLQGTPGSQTFTAQWTNVCAYRTSGGTALNFQVILYEGTNVIEFRYGPKTAGTYLTGQSASIGITNAIGGPGNYLDAMTGSSRCGHWFLSESQWPTYNFRFTPGAPAALAAGTYTVGVGQTYRNLTTAVADVNQRGISGPITLDLVDAVVDTTAAGGNTMFPILFGPVVGTSSTNTITVSRTGSPATIRWSGNATGSTGGGMIGGTTTAFNTSNVEPIIGLVGTDYLTLNNVDLRGNVGFQNADHAIGVYNNSATDGSTNNTFSNFSVIMRRANTGTRGVVQNVPVAPSAATGANSNNTFRDFSITNVYAGMQFTGNATWPDQATAITRTNCATFNTIGDAATANDIGNSTTATYGIQLQNQSNFTCRYNEIRNVTNTGGQADGINILTYQGFCDVNNNKIRGIRNAGAASTTGISGIRATHTTTGNHNLRIYNNAISDITSGYTGAASAVRVLKGIHIAGTGGATTQFYEIYNNSVSLNGSGSPNCSSACLEFATTAGPLFFVRNNSLANFTATQPTPATTRHFGVFHTSATLVGNTGSGITNNNVYIANDAGLSGFTALGSTTTYNGILAWETGTAPQTGANIEVNPAYTDNSADLHSGAAGMNGSGFASPPPYLTVDLDCATRTPDNDIGAYLINACTGATAGTISGAGSACSAQGTTLNLTGSSTGLGISYQWAWSSTPGGPYTNLLGTAISQSTLSLLPGTYYIVVDVTCSAGPVTATTPEFVFVNNQTPTVSAANNGPVCAGVQLDLLGTTDVGNVFTWTGPNGFSSTSEDPSIPNASLTAGGTYTFTASLNGCASTPATTNAVVAPLPTISATTATPNPTCIGGNSQLNVTALVDVPFVRITEITFFRTGTGQTTPWPATIPTGPDDYVELNNTSGLPADISGWTYADYPTGSATANHSLTFPPGTVIPPNGFIVIGLATGTNDPVNYYYAATGTSGLYGSGSNACFILRNSGGTIVDAVATNTATFNAGLGVTPADWSGAGASAPSGNAGSRRTAAIDSNTGADWTNSAGVGGTQTIGTFNPGYTNSNQSAPASYLWTPNTYLDFDNISNPLASGVLVSTPYTVTVTSNVGCTAQGTVTLNTTAPISAATITGVPEYCTGGSTTLTAVPSDGGAPYTYLWSPNGETTASITVSTPGDYNCQVADACFGSVNTGNVNVVENPLPNVTITPNAATYCTGNAAVMLTASGADTYTWAPATGLDATTGTSVNANPAATTTYTVTGTDGNGCVNTATTTITNNGLAPTIASVTATPSSVCSGANSQLQVNMAGPSSYCATSYTTGTGSGDYLTSVSIPGTSLNNPTTASGSPYYTLYPASGATTATLTAGAAYTLNAIAGTYTINDVAVWIDYNQDGVFQEPGEKLGQVDNFGASPAVASIPFTVPLSALNGATRMRVREADQGAAMPACGGLTYGEVEDYVVTITGGASLTISWSPATYLDNTTIANPLASGVTTAETYTVTVTQGLCSSTGTVSVTLDNTDTDGDLTIDCIDGCPTDPTKIAPGVCGCGVPDTDTDGDLTADCVDGCPNDGTKTAPGQCGCGVPDTDTDGDLTADCIDGCPTDPNKITAGICGCGVADTDSDSDGTADCIDGCPADPNKIAPGLCGCGFGEPGASCNDGNPNTIFDTVLGDCSCVGTPADCEGTPNGPALPGTSCNDNDVCTINDTWSNQCVCVGTFEDTDGDGTCNANDGCPNDPNKIAPGICGCGVADTDSDADGVADCNDPCPTLPFLVNGDPCDDGDPCTINDVVTACVCAGTPAPVTAGITASSTVYCTPGSGVTLTATGGDTYSWAPATGLSATTGSPVTATPAATTTYTLTATNLAGCSDTETVTLTTGSTPATPIMSAQPNTALCPGGNTQLGATIGGGTGVYCIPSLSTGCSFPDIITNVTVAGINRSSACDNLSGSNGYSNFASPTGALVAGSTGNSYSITTSGDVEGAALWIDFNQNGTFENPSELIFNSYAGTNPATYSGTFSVPAGAINGNTRLRVRCTYAGAPGTDACGPALTYGETEDYTVNITGGAPNCAAGINFSWSPTTYLDNPLICNPLASGVMTATTYTVTATNAAGCSSTGTIAVNVETTDTDNDGTVNCLDGCPNDANKTAPGQCGCGVPDTDTDGDLTADCNDGCPTDPNKIAPGICGCGVADTDTDGDATADCFDLCPTDPNKIVPGVCGCGTPDTDTDNDGVADCIDSCPLVSGVIGTACNDNNPATLNDALDANCVCTGSTLSCPDQSVVLDLTTDNSGAQTSWDIVNVGTSNVQCSGSGYLNNQSVSIGCCLATGCYELRVFDSAGDGMANGTIGGYVLRLPDGTRIIDNSGDGIFTFTSQISNNLGFCVPVGTNSVIPAHCDKANWLPNEVIQAQVNAAVTAQFGVTNSTSGYQFWFFSPDGGYTRRVLQTHAAPGVVTGAPANVRAAYLDLSSITTSPLPLYTNLNVRIRVQIAGVYSEWGPACRFRIDPPCSTTQLTTSANPVVSCGATGLTLSSTIHANNVAGANRYQFEFTRPGYLRRIASSSRSQILNWVTNPLQNNTCYNVRVRVSFDGGTTYCAFGPTCTVTIGTAFCNQAMPTQPETFTNATETGRLTVFPNPNNGDQVTLVLSSFDRSVNNIQVDVNDIYGKFITRRNIAVQDGYMNTVLSFQQELAPGMYLLNLQAGEQRFTQRMIVQ